MSVFFLDTFDVIMRTDNEIVLVDFGPLNAKTKLYTFKWSEIKEIIQKVRFFLLFSVTVVVFIFSVAVEF